MNEIIEQILATVGEANLSNACDRDGCVVSLVDVPTERIIVDADLAFPAHGLGGERCDFVVFLTDDDGDLRAMPVELKSGSIPIAKAVRQLRKGAEFINQFAPEHPSPACRPILIHGRSISSRERKRLNRLKVAFRGLQLTIKTARCGQDRNLARALKM